MVLYLMLSISFKIVEPAIIIYLLPLPATLDWLTQTLKWRESTTSIRLVTGGLFGIWMAIVLKQLSLWNLPLFLPLLYQISLYLLAVAFSLLAKRGALDDYLEPYEKFIQDYQNSQKQ
ncbi:hypothetical protein D3C87_1801630 [compost metagenome]